MTTNAHQEQGMVGAVVCADVDDDTCTVLVHPAAIDALTTLITAQHTPGASYIRRALHGRAFWARETGEGPLHTSRRRSVGAPPQHIFISCRFYFSASARREGRTVGYHSDYLVGRRDVQIGADDDCPAQLVEGDRVAGRARARAGNGSRRNDRQQHERRRRHQGGTQAEDGRTDRIRSPRDAKARAPRPSFYVFSHQMAQAAARSGFVLPTGRDAFSFHSPVA